MRAGPDAADLDACAETEARRLLAAAFETVPARPGPAVELAASASPGAAGGAPGDLLGRVRKRAAGQRRRRILVPAAAVALAAATTGGVTTGVLTGRTARSPGALQVITAALVKTSAQSFNFTASQTYSPAGRQPTAPGQVAGVFDPASGTGQEVLPDGGYDRQIRLAGGYEYASMTPQEQASLSHGKPWLKGLPPRPLSSSTPGLTLQIVTHGADGNEPLNPADLLRLLKSAADVRAEGPATGSGWTGTKYGFTVPPGKLGPGVTSVSGTVAVDSSGRVRELMTATVYGQGPGGSRTATYDMTFGDFGTPVAVTAPPADAVYNLGNVHVIFVGSGGTP